VPSRSIGEELQRGLLDEAALLDAGGIEQQ
jgi:hypothetical protein